MQASLPPASRLPVWHPLYRYVASRNPYWKRLYELQHPGELYLDHAAETERGKWSQFLPSDKGNIRLEIGCNGGHVLLALAQRHPRDLFIGLDFKHKQIFRAAEKAKKHQIKNAIFIRAHAERLPYLFAGSEIDQIDLFFPDPWPKKNRIKNRLCKAQWFLEAAVLLSKNGMLRIKTDHGDYFEQIIEESKRTLDCLEVESLDRDLHRSHPNPATLKIPDITLFESLFIKDGIPIKSLILRKKSDQADV